MRATVNPVMFTKAEALRLEASHVNSLAQIIGFISYLRFGPAVSKRPQPPPPTERIRLLPRRQNPLRQTAPVIFRHPVFPLEKVGDGLRSIRTSTCRKLARGELSPS